MKSFIVPSGCGTIAAALSLGFFTLFAYRYGEQLFAELILVLAMSAIVQLAVVPQSWLYLIGATDSADLLVRYRVGMAVEFAALPVGLAGIALAASVPGSPLADQRSELLLMFMGLWVAGSTSHQGYFRQREQWRRFSIWVLLPPVVRLTLVIAAPFLHARHVGPPTLLVVVILYYLIPDLCRLLLLNALQIIRHFRPLPLKVIASGARRILHNWLFDIGSGVVENGDKLIVGALVSPAGLITYFFARRIGAAITISIEPVYTELYRRQQSLPARERERRLGLPYLLGIAIGLVITMAAGLAYLISLQSDWMARYIPGPIRAEPLAFFAILAIDAWVSANRWSRYVFDKGRGSIVLLGIRLMLLGVFGCVLVLLTAQGVEHAVVIAFAAMLGLEASFLAFVLAQRRLGA